MQRLILWPSFIVKMESVEPHPTPKTRLKSMGNQWQFGFWKSPSWMPIEYSTNDFLELLQDRPLLVSDHGK